MCYFSKGLVRYAKIGSGGHMSANADNSVFLAKVFHMQGNQTLRFPRFYDSPADASWRIFTPLTRKVLTASDTFQLTEWCRIRDNYIVKADSF